MTVCYLKQRKSFSAFPKLHSNLTFLTGHQWYKASSLSLHLIGLCDRPTRTRTDKIPFRFYSMCRSPLWSHSLSIYHKAVSPWRLACWTAWQAFSFCSSEPWLQAKTPALLFRWAGGLCSDVIPLKCDLDTPRRGRERTVPSWLEATSMLSTPCL